MLVAAMRTLPEITRASAKHGRGWISGRGSSRARRRAVTRVRILVNGQEATLNYRIAYAVGFHPWEDAEEQPAFTERISELFEVTDLGPTGFQAPKPVELLMSPDERWYRLRRE